MSGLHKEESGEPVSSDRNGGTEWLCPLCQKVQTNRSSLSLHLTEQHSVLPSCVNRLLDIADLKQGAKGGDEDKGAEKSSDAESSQLRPPEDVGSDPIQSSKSSDATQTPADKEMEDERLMEQEGGEAEPEEEGNQLTGAKRQNATENTENSDAGERSAGKNCAPTENNTRSFKCNACLEMFPSRTALSVHYNSSSHIQRMTTGSAKPGGENDPQTPSVPILSRPYISNKPYQCAVCRVSYNHAITLESHMKSVLHQTRSRNAGIAAANNTVGSAGMGGGTPAPNAVVSSSGGGSSPLATTTTCAAPVMVTTTKDGEQIPTSQVAPSLLTSPVASAQAVSAFLTLLTSSPSTLSHSLLPSLFAAGAAPGATTHQLVPQPQMVMPFILNGLQAQTQQHQDNQQGQLLTQCVPFVGLSTAQQALLTQRLNSLQSQWPSVGVPTNTQPCPEEQKQTIKTEREQEKQDGEEAEEDKVSAQTKDSENWMTENIKTEKFHEEDTKDFTQCPNIESKVKAENNEDKGKAQRDITTDGDCSTNQLDLEGDKAASLNLSPAGTEKSLRNNSLSPSASVPSNSTLSPVNLNLTLSPDSTPQKSQSSPCGSLGTPKSSPSTNALTNNQTRPHCNTMGSMYPDLPVLSEFQSEVLWAFFESRSEADAASPPHEDCEALGREVGLSEEEVRRWLSRARHAKQRQRATDSYHKTGFTRPGQSSDNDYDDEESSLIIAEGEDEAEASGSQAIDLSSTRGKRRQRDLGREGQGDSCLTSDSENEVYTSVIVSDEESQNGSLREGPESPAKGEAQREVHMEKGLAGGKVLRSTTVFLSDAEDEYEEEEEEGGERARRKKRKGEFERDEVEVKKERQDPDVDLELEAQGDPPSSQSHLVDHREIPAGALHSLPLSLTHFATPFLSPYVLSLTPSVVGDGNKVPVFPNPPAITRFSSSLLSQSLSSSQTSHYLSNGGDCEAALDLSMGKNSSKSASSSSSSSSLADKIAAQKGQLLDGLGLRPTSKGLVVVQVKPETVSAMPSSNSSMSLVNCNNMTKSNIYMRAAEKMNTTLLEREREKEREKEKEREQEQQQQQRKSKGKRYRDMRRSRTIIQAEQLDILYGCYFKDPNPGKHEFEQISEWVHLPKKVVQIWFQNMRARERKGEVRFISDGTLAAVGKPLIKFTWPLSKPIFSNKPTSNNTSCITTTPIVRTLMKTERESVKELGKPTVVKKITPVPIKPKEVISSAAASPVGSAPSAVPKTKLETTSSVTMVKVTPKVSTPVLLAPPKDPIPIAPRPAQKRKLEEESEEEKTDEERDNENEMGPGPGTTNRMVPKLPTTPINNRPPATTVVPQKQNGLNYWTPKVPIKINTLSREQLALPTHTPPRTIPPPPTPSIAPVSPNTPSSTKVASPTTPVMPKSSPTESSFLPHSSSRRPRTHLSCLQLSILQSCYETCAHPNAMECEAIGTELNLPLKVVQIWFQNTRAKEKRWRLQQEKMSPLSGGKVDMSSGSYLQYNALKANRPILPKPVQLTVTEPSASPVAGQPVPKETLTGRCDACNVSFESRAAARAHVFSPRHLATLRTTNFGQPTTLVNKNGTGTSTPVPGSQASLSTPVTTSCPGGEMVMESPPPMATSNS
ncbi:zinc finger homeobox protein 4 isoform X2 [Lates calcarifer]|uniref:Zinc finger homeobox protein 4 isoform X2 n=1 Tax=Lates calcarifer TaxID=8187 RepID=A0AAJ8AZ22_LATCA|nr:zinc finger homeobox protein 4 isoform X2 [Lates calcarifer]